MMGDDVLQFHDRGDVPELDDEDVDLMVSRLEQLLALARSRQLKCLAIAAERMDGPNCTTSRCWIGLVSMTLVGVLDVLKDEIKQAWLDCGSA